MTSVFPVVCDAVLVLGFELPCKVPAIVKLKLKHDSSGKTLTLSHFGGVWVLKGDICA